MDARRLLDVARRTVALVREHNVTFMAGSIAYAAFLSLLPLLLLLFIIAGAVGNELLTERITAMAESHLSPAGEGLVYEALTNASERAGASLIGVVSLVWGMLRVFRGVDTALDELYGAGEETFLDKIRDGLVVFVALVVAVLGVSAAAALLAAVDHPVVQALNPLVLLVGLVVAFFPIYRLLPDADVDAREALPGAAVAAVGWVALEVVFGLYADLVDTVGTYETLGAVILLLIWLYGNALVLLTGAALNVVLADHDLEEQADAETGADGEPA